MVLLKATPTKTDKVCLYPLQGVQGLQRVLKHCREFPEEEMLNLIEADLKGQAEDPNPKRANDGCIPMDRKDGPTDVSFIAVLGGTVGQQTYAYTCADLIDSTLFAKFESSITVIKMVVPETTSGAAYDRSPSKRQANRDKMSTCRNDRQISTIV